MPVAFLRTGPAERCAPVTADAWTLGTDPTGGLVDPSPGVAPRHAVLRYRTGEYLLSAADGQRVWVNDAPAPLMALRDGDVVRLDPQAPPWRFRNRMEGSFRPPGSSLAAAWMGHPAFADPASGPEGLGPAEGIAGRDPARCWRAGERVVKVLGPARDGADPDRHLTLLGVLGGAEDAGMARLVGGGLAPGAETVRRWIATAWVEGRCARDLVAAGGVDARAALAVLEPLGRALALLHRRGVVHRDVAPGNVIVTRGGGGVLIDFGQALLRAEGAPASRGIVGTPGYVAPEEVLEGGAAVAAPVDVYGLAAVGYALVTGVPPAGGDDLLATLARATAAPPSPSALGIELPEALESALLAGLSPNPASRPTAEAFVGALGFARTQSGLGGVANPGGVAS